MMNRLFQPKNMSFLFRLFILITVCTYSSISSFASLYDDFLNYKNKYKDHMAVVLNRTQSVDISVNKKTGELDIYETDREELLYLKRTAKFYTDQSISLSEFFESIESISVTVIRPNGKKFKLKKNDFRVVDSPPSSWVFHDDDKEMIFDLKELDEGYRTIIEYTKKVKRPEFFDVFHFIEVYPLEKGVVELTYPADMELAFFERAMEKYDFIRKDEVVKKGRVKKSWMIENLEAYRTEDGATNVKNHIPHVIAQIRSYKFNGEEKRLIGTLKELHTYFQEFLLLKEDESNRKELNDITRSLIEGKESELAKMDTIFAWVQDNIKYIAFEDGINGYVPRACNAVMKNRYGDCKDMGNLLVEMLTFAGVQNAYVAWVGTRDIPYQMSEIPAPFTCNHVICVVKRGDNDYYYLDATNTEGSYLIPPEEVQGKELLIHLGQDKFELFKVPAAPAEGNYIKTVVKYRFEGDSLVGTGSDYYGGYERDSRTWYLKNQQPEDLFDYVKEMALGGANRFSLHEYELKNLYDRNKELILTYSFAAENVAIHHGNQVILNPTLFKPRVTRYNPEDYKLTRKKKRHRTIDYTFELQLPEGYLLKHLPEDVHYKHDLFHFDGTFKFENNTVTVFLTYAYRLLELPPALFEDWNEFSRHINQATTQNIILEKIPNTTQP